MRAAERTLRLRHRVYGSKNGNRLASCVTTTTHRSQTVGRGAANCKPCVLVWAATHGNYDKNQTKFLTMTTLPVAAPCAKNKFCKRPVVTTATWITLWRQPNGEAYLHFLLKWKAIARRFFYSVFLNDALQPTKPHVTSVVIMHGFAATAIFLFACNHVTMFCRVRLVIYAFVTILTTQNSMLVEHRCRITNRNKH